MIVAVSAAGCAHGHAQAPLGPPDRSGWVVVPHVTPVAQTGDTDCGPSALATALGRWDAVPARDRLAAANGASAGALRDEARRLGFAAYVVEGSFDDLASEIALGHPVVVGLVTIDRDARIAHFAVVVGHDAGARRWLVADPALGVRALSTDGLRDPWARAGWVTLVVAPPSEAPAAP